MSYCRESVWESPLMIASCGSSLVSLEVFSPAQILLIVQTTAIRHSFFLSSLFSIFFTLEFKKLFFSQFLLFFSVFFSTLSCFLFESAFLSFLFSYLSILSASPLCSITTQSVLFLLFTIFQSPLSNTYFPSILLLLLFSLNTFFW